MKKLSKYQKTVFIGLGLIILFNLLGFIKVLDDLYTDYIYWIFADVLGFLTNLLPFALGEILMILGALLVVVSAIFALVLLIFRKRQRVRKVAKVYYKIISVLVVVTLLLYTFHWTIPFRAHELEPNAKAPKEFTFEYLRETRKNVIDRLNTVAAKIERDAEGNPVKGTMDKDVKIAMQNLSKEFSRLKGYYPDMKEALCTDFLEYMSIGGYTYPYTMELTNNKYISSMYYPVLYAHEAAHHKGYYKESEAVFLSCIALEKSDNDYLKYAALFEEYWYIEEAFLASIPDDMDFEALENEAGLTWQSAEDWNNALAEAERLYEEDHHSFEEIRDTVEDIGNVGWDVQEDVLVDEEEDINYSYDGCVKLFLAYWYEG